MQKMQKRFYTFASLTDCLNPGGDSGGGFVACLLAQESIEMYGAFSSIWRKGNDRSFPLTFSRLKDMGAKCVLCCIMAGIVDEQGCYVRPLYLF